MPTCRARASCRTRCGHGCRVHTEGRLEQQHLLPAAAPAPALACPDRLLCGTLPLPLRRTGRCTTQWWPSCRCGTRRWCALHASVARRRSRVCAARACAAAAAALHMLRCVCVAGRQHLAASHAVLSVPLSPCRRGSGGRRRCRAAASHGGAAGGIGGVHAAQPAHLQVRRLTRGGTAGGQVHAVAPCAEPWPSPPFPPCAGTQPTPTACTVS